MEKPHVLLVDDDKDFFEGLRVMFEEAGFRISWAGDGDAALQLVRKQKPDLVVLDVMMPKRDGYSVCHDMKSDDLTSSIPVIMLTSLGNAVDGKTGAEKLAMGHKAEAYFDKPVKPDVLIEKTKELIEQAAQAKREPIQVLLIDDDPDFIAGVKLILEENDFDVTVSYTGEDGLSSVFNGRPDIILLDVMLPGKDGFSVCKEIKENEKTSGIPILMLTSVGEKITEGEYAKAVAVTHHADDYIEKPVEPRELLKRIRKFVGPGRRLV